MSHKKPYLIKPSNVRKKDYIFPNSFSHFNVKCNENRTSRDEETTCRKALFNYLKFKTETRATVTKEDKVKQIFS
jgi:hypothetical protein